MAGTPGLNTNSAVRYWAMAVIAILYQRTIESNAINLTKNMR
jgi:hypothetical protein